MYTVTDACVQARIHARHPVETVTKGPDVPLETGVSKLISSFLPPNPQFLE